MADFVSLEAAEAFVDVVHQLDIAPPHLGQPCLIASQASWVHVAAAQPPVETSG